MNPSRIRNPSPSNDQSYRNVLSKSPGLVILYQSIGPVHLPSLRCWVPIPRQLPVSVRVGERTRTDRGKRGKANGMQADRGGDTGGQGEWGRMERTQTGK